MRVPDPLAYLTGSWTVTRDLNDAGRTGTFAGTATFTPDATGLAYEERGTLSLPHWQGDSYRRLHYARGSSFGVLTVTFEDGRYFHDLDLRTGEWTAHHPCRADAYEGRFTVLSQDEWHQEWLVRGPAKDQVIVSAFTRISSGTAPR